jgi:superfamily II RNA helicase
VVLSTPTGSGKSLVALGLHWKALCEGRRSFYTAPVKAPGQREVLRAVRGAGAGAGGHADRRRQHQLGGPVICATAEVLANMALRQGERADAPYVVMDEFHFYADPSAARPGRCRCCCSSRPSSC